MSKSALRVRRATPRDAEAMAGVHGRSWPFAYEGLIPAQQIDAVVAGRERRAERMRQFLADPSSLRRAWVATVDDVVVGLAIWSPSQDADASEAVADVEAMLWVLESNRRARKFYESCWMGT